jgi:hypothetical protein
MLAYELLAKLRCLTLVGQNHFKELEWIGTDKQWKALQFEEECILMDWKLSRNFNQK